MNMQIIHHPGQKQFSLEQEPGAHLDYELRSPDVLDFRETFVPEASREAGIGEDMVRQALDWAAAHGYQVVPSCPFVRRFIEQHAEYHGMVSGVA